jgi:hypothetical protein
MNDKATTDENAKKGAPERDEKRLGFIGFGLTVAPIVLDARKLGYYP